MPQPAGTQNPGTADEVLRKVFAAGALTAIPGGADALLRAVYDAANAALRVSLIGGVSPYALVHAGQPVDGVTGVGVVAESGMLWDSVAKVPYVNVGTIAAPVWRGLFLVVP